MQMYYFNTLLEHLDKVVVNSHDPIGCKLYLYFTLPKKYFVKIKQV